MNIFSFSWLSSAFEILHSESETNKNKKRHDSNGIGTYHYVLVQLFTNGRYDFHLIVQILKHLLILRC